jgi:hypothetical protein
MTYKIAVDDNIRDATAEETAAIDAEIKANEKAKSDKAKAKQAVLDRLGITADEAALLLG